MCNVTLEIGAKLLNNIIKDNFPKLNKNMKLQIRRHIVYPKKKKKKPWYRTTEILTYLGEITEF